VEAGLGDRVAFHWRGEGGEERDVTYASLHADVQRFANALKERGIKPGDVVGIFLPMIPEVAVAMLACARIGAIHNVVFGGFSVESVRERMEFSDAKALITVDGARRKGRTAPIKQAVDEEMGGLPQLATVIVVRHTGDRVRADRGARLLVPRADGGRGPRLPGRAVRFRAPAVHPLHVGLHGKAQGHPAHDRRLSHPGRVHAQGGLRSQARGGRLLVLGRRRLGDRTLLHRLRAARQRRHLRHVRGRARLSRQGHLVGAVRALRA
jgi:hypothetical protein